MATLNKLPKDPIKEQQIQNFRASLELLIKAHQLMYQNLDINQSWQVPINATLRLIRDQILTLRNQIENLRSY